MFRNVVLTAALTFTQALVHQQSILIPVHNQGEEGIDPMATLPSEADVHRFIERLPRSLHLSQQDKQQHQQPTETPLDTLVEEENEGDDKNDDDADQGLVVAWQYRTDVQHERLGLTYEAAKGRDRQAQDNIFCHSYDLSTHLKTQMDVRSSVAVCHISMDPSNMAFSFAQALLRKLKVLITQKPNQVTRILIMDWHLGVLAKALPIILSHIRSEDLPVVLMIKNGVTSEESIKWKGVVQRSSDVALEAESFVSRSVHPPPPEFRDFVGVVKVHKASTFTLAATVGHFANLTNQRRPAANVYGVKRDSRKLHLSLLHIPPEDYAAEGGSVGKGAERSGAGKSVKQSMGCATSGGGIAVPDF